MASAFAFTRGEDSLPTGEEPVMRGRNGNLVLYQPVFQAILRKGLGDPHETYQSTAAGGLVFHSEHSIINTLMNKWMVCMVMVCMVSS